MNPFDNKITASEYDDFYRSTWGQKIDELEKNIVTPIVSGIKPCTMLEIGCGTGHWTSYFATFGFAIIAIDISKHMLEIATKKNIPNTTFQIASAEQIPYCNDSFNFTAAITVLEFCSNPQKVLQEIYRITKHNGKILLGCLNASSLLYSKQNPSSVLQHANLFQISELMSMASFIGKIDKHEAVYIDEDLNIYSHSLHYPSAFFVLDITVNKK
ncbi:MAG: class I SAM-dependent methyltransferase [Bacteroidales bacterium]|nr:class I SAM-dependent methyltransferase [Bacteroidales bacterium]